MRAYKAHDRRDMQQVHSRARRWPGHLKYGDCNGHRAEQNSLRKIQLQGKGDQAKSGLELSVPGQNI